MSWGIYENGELMDTEKTRSSGKAYLLGYIDDRFESLVFQDFHRLFKDEETHSTIHVDGVEFTVRED